MPRLSHLLATAVCCRGEMETLESWGEAEVRAAVYHMSWRDLRGKACVRCCVEPSSHSLLQNRDKCGPGKDCTSFLIHYHIDISRRTYCFRVLILQFLFRSFKGELCVWQFLQPLESQ